MKVDNKIAKLICDLEYCIGSECYNPNSYDGWTGEEGREFRYPVCVRALKKDDRLTKVYGSIPSSISRITPDTVNTVKYIFGSNHLFVGIGIRRILERLEERYGIDFNELEQNIAAKK